MRSSRSFPPAKRIRMLTKTLFCAVRRVKHVLYARHHRQQCHIINESIWERRWGGGTWCRDQHQQTTTTSKQIVNALQVAGKTRVNADVIYLLAVRAPNNERRKKYSEKKIIIDQATFSVAFVRQCECSDDAGIQLQASLHTNIFRVLTPWRPNDVRDASHRRRRRHRRLR